MVGRIRPSASGHLNARITKLALNGKKGKPVEVDLVEFLFRFYNLDDSP